MKLTKIIPLCCSILLLGGCSNNNTSTTPSTSTTATSEQKSAKLTSIDPGKIYIDINFATLPAGFAIKYADQTITSTTTIEVPANTTFTVEGELNNISFYYIQEDNSTFSTTFGVKENVDEEVAKERVKTSLESIAKKAEGKRNYFCVTDTVKGWSKTVPGVNEILSSYVN